MKRLIRINIQFCAEAGLYGLELGLLAHINSAYRLFYVPNLMLEIENVAWTHKVDNREFL